LEYFTKKLDKKAVFLVISLISIILAFVWSEATIAVIGVVLGGLATYILKEEKKPEEEFTEWPFPTSKPTIPPATSSSAIRGTSQDLVYLDEIALLMETPVSVPEPAIEAPVEVQTPKKRGRKPKKTA
jgi:hypothetical protein